MQYQKKTTQIKRTFNRNIDQTVLSFDNKTLFERKHIIVNPFFLRIIKNLVKDNMRVFWSKMIKNIKKSRAIKSNKFFRKNDQVFFEEVIPQISLFENIKC